MATLRRLVVFAALLLLVPIVSAQFAERNVNMVSGQQWPGGDPFLRQQNEPSIAVSTRNPLHLLAAANDYRSVDIPFNAPSRPDEEETGDAWIGIFKSKDGGNRWWSTLLDGYPQLTNSTSPLKGFQAAADPVVRAGNNGMFYATGIVLNRGANPLGGVWVARFIDNNNSEVGDPIVYLDTKLLQQGTSGQFIDKPWFAVDPKPNGLQCTVAGQTFPAQNLYLAYTVFVGGDNNIRTKMMFARSQDCGATWGSPVKLSETFPINQGATIVAGSNSNTVYVAWRRFAAGNDPNSIILAKSSDGGKTFTKGTAVANITPFEQGTGSASIRTNAYPAMAMDGNGRVYIAWSQRNVNGDGRLVMINSTDGLSWTATVEVAPLADRGHQFMPAMTFADGILTLAWYDLKQDHSVGTYTPNALGYYDESRRLVGNLFLGQPSVVFWNLIADISPDPNITLLRRHTLEVFAADSSGGLMPAFTTARVSRYKFGSWGGSNIIQDLQINPPNLPMFRQGTVPFFGDYIDIASYAGGGPASASAPQAVTETVASKPSRVRHVVWTDNRDVRPPLGSPPDWTKYTPVNSSALGGTSKFDPTKQTTPCTNPVLDATGSRNQNIYTARVTDGMFAGSPGNAKPLGTIMRAFTVFVQNARDTLAAYRLTILQQPQGGTASFLQFDATVSSIDVAIPPHSTATRTVFVTGAPHARVDVNITEITAAGGAEVPGGLSSVVGFNTDPQNPDIGNPDIGNPDIGNAEVFNPDIGNPDIGNPDIGNPDIGNPDIGNPDIGNPDIGNPDIGNPDIGNPDIGNPDIGNPDIGNPDIGNGSVTDTTWPADNEGNTTGGYTVKLVQTAPLPPNVTKSQLILHKVYDTPIARDCNLGVEHHRQIVASINDPDFTTIISDAFDPSLTDPSEKNATLWLAPKEKGYITVRLIDPVNKGLTLDASQFVAPVVVAHSVNTLDADDGATTPTVSLAIITKQIPDALLGTEFYDATIETIGGVGNKTFSGGQGLPAGLTLLPTGHVFGSAVQLGSFPFTATVTDSRTPTPATRTSTIQFRIINRLGIPPQTLEDAGADVPYTATVTKVGGVAPYTWSLVDSSLPDGLSLSQDGVISGTPTTIGQYSFVVRVQDGAYPTPQSATASLSLNVVQTFTVQATLTYNGLSRTPSSTPQFFVRSEDTGLQVLPTITWSGGSTFIMSGLRAGNFGVEVVSDEDLDGRVNYPGDFYSWTTFDSVSGSDGGIIVMLRRLIHLTSPHDNDVEMTVPLACPATLTANPTQITWEAIDIPDAVYSYRIDVKDCPRNVIATPVSETTTGTSSTIFDPLGPSATGQDYELNITATSPQGIPVGLIMTNAPNGWGWDDRWIVPVFVP